MLNKGAPTLHPTAQEPTRGQCAQRETFSRSRNAGFIRATQLTVPDAPCLSFVFDVSDKAAQKSSLTVRASR
jgi:hypothetical protein